VTAVAPSGVVTFLFTDIEGSTRRWEADTDGMRAALAAHDEVLRSAIESHDGFLFKHTGDGVCAAFSSPKSAVDAAVAAQRAPELPVRIGLATGEAELRDGDYFGAVLNRAAGVMAAGTTTIAHRRVEAGADPGLRGSLQRHQTSSAASEPPVGSTTERSACHACWSDGCSETDV
jgi:class 3 adenylate cyclase